MRGGALIALLLLPIPASAASTSRAQYLMGTVCEITAESASEIQRAFDEGRRIERLISTWRDDSELSALNRAGRFQVSGEVRDLLQRSVEISRRTGGSFNPLMAPLIDVWKTRAQGALPSSEAIETAMRRSQTANIEFAADGVVTLRNGAEVEEGAFGKGYALDRMLRQIPGAHMVLNFGGQLLVRGEAKVVVADPERRDVPVVSFTIRDVSLSTSSGSEKTFEIHGRRFTHILDPRSGQALPPRGSVSVLADEAFTADALSTALYVLGASDGLRWADANGVAALFITPEHQIRTSAAFRGRVHDAVIVDGHFQFKD